MIADLVADGSGTVAIAFAGIWDTEARYGPLIGTVTRYGIDVTPADWAPWFVWDYGLEDVVPYIRSLDRVLAEGPAWQRRRGTDRGIEIGIGWVESEGVVAAPDGRHSWWELQIGFAAPAEDIDQVRQLDGIVRLSKASEDELFRMFSPAADFRPIRMDAHRFDDGLFDGYSGTVLWDGGPLISFGWSANIVIDPDCDLGGGDEITESGVIHRDDGFRYDLDRFESRAPAIVESFAEIEIGSPIEAFARDHWPNRWLNSWAAAAQPRVAASAWEIL